MTRVLRLGLFAIVVVVVLLGAAYLFREPLLRAVGINLDRGAAGETELVLAEGYSAGVFASGLDHPRFMAVAPDGTLFVAEPARTASWRSRMLTVTVERTRSSRSGETTTWRTRSPLPLTDRCWSRAAARSSD